VKISEYVLSMLSPVEDYRLIESIEMDEVLIKKMVDESNEKSTGPEITTEMARIYGIKVFAIKEPGIIKLNFKHKAFE